MSWMKPCLQTWKPILRAAFHYSVADSKASSCLASVSSAGKYRVCPCWPHGLVSRLISLSSSFFSEHPTCFPCTLTAPVGAQAWPFSPLSNTPFWRWTHTHAHTHTHTHTHDWRELRCPAAALAACGDRCSVEGVEGKGLLLAAQSSSRLPSFSAQ